jgi:hypothetical protein
MNASQLAAVLLLVVGTVLQSNASAQEPDGMTIDLSQETIDSSQETAGWWPGSSAARLHRAGCPNCIAPWARFTYGRRYCGYFVGGGAALYGKSASLLRGELRYPYEGTWGVDYNPWFTRVRLQWFHSRRRQDGEGSYEADHKNNPLIPLIFR